MLKIKNWVFSFIFILNLNSCQDYSNPQPIVNEHFQIVLPGFIKEEELAEDAVLEYANRFRNFYVVAFVLNDTVSQDSLWSITTKRISSGLLDSKVDSSHKGNYILSHIKGNFKNEKEPIFYTQKLIYSRGNSLLLTLWTRGQERHKKYEGEINDIINSFKPTK
jgi:hypothetical protein